MQTSNHNFISVALLYIIAHCSGTNLDFDQSYTLAYMYLIDLTCNYL